MKITVNNENYDVELSFTVVNALDNENKQYIMIGNEKVVDDNYIFYIGQVSGDKLLGISEEDWTNVVKDNVTSLLGNKIKAKEALQNQTFTIEGNLKGLQIPVNAINAYRESIKEEVITDPVTPVDEMNNEEVVAPELDMTTESSAIENDQQIVPTVEEPVAFNNPGVIDEPVIDKNEFADQINNELNNNTEIDNNTNDVIIDEKYQKILNELNNIKQDVYELEELINNRVKSL